MRIPSVDALRGLLTARGRRAAMVTIPLVLAIPATGAIAGGVRAVFGGDRKAPLRAELVNVPRRSTAPVNLSFDSLLGRSGRLRTRLMPPAEVANYPALREHFGVSVVSPGIRMLVVPRDNSDFAFITLKPWRDKLGSHINSYHVGWWPGERRAMPSNYDNPDGFIEVTKEAADLRLSTHFTLRDFLTHDQERVWPKYLVLREELIDKLELVLATLEAQGIPTRHVVVLSGFRTPQYNARATFEGAAYASRHQFGDAADVIIDADRNGRMDDLNRDGVVDFADTDVINRAVEKVEQRYPELVGGLGLYHAMGPRGPFAHIDVRGTRARWTGNTRSASAGRTRQAAPREAAVSVRKCNAEGEMAALCTRMK